MQENIPVTFQPQARTVHVLEGTKLIEAAAEAGIVLDSPCGGEGTCGKCRVTISPGAPAPGDAERRHLSARQLDQGVRLACQCALAAPAVVEVPQTSLLSAQYKILSRTQTAGLKARDPVISKQYVELPPPERGNDHADLARLERAVGPLEIDLEMLRRLPGAMRQGEFRGTAVLAGRSLMGFESGCTEKECFAVSIDVGTTTLAATLLDLAVGHEMAVATRLNPQTALGDDVLSRILHARENPQGTAQLQQLICTALDEMIGELAQQAAIARERIYEITLAGNTTMQQLVLGIDPRWLGEVPFVPVTTAACRAPAMELGFRIHPRGRVYVLPVIGGFVGGDTVAGIVATGMTDSAGPTLLVDIGTNGEIVLLAGGKLLAASTAAGPAFEGARISQGMRASNGAIEKVVVDGQFRFQTIGGAPPVGICGSALVDLAAELLRHQVLSSEGRLRLPDELPDGVLPDLRRRVVVDQGKASFVLAFPGDAGAAAPVAVTQRDFRELQLASGAIRAGIHVLLRQAGVQTSDLERVLLAGGFGNFIRRKNAQRIGLLPEGIPRQRIVYQGNTSLAGAQLAAFSRTARTLAEELARRTRHVDLSSDPEFRWAFADAMLFPNA